LSPAKVTFIKWSLTVRRYGVRGGVAALLPHHRIVHNDLLLPTVLIKVTSARLKCKLPDDGSRPKHVGAILICFNVMFNDM